jgi:hypothetical protein
MGPIHAYLATGGGQHMSKSEYGQYSLSSGGHAVGALVSVGLFILPTRLYCHCTIRDVSIDLFTRASALFVRSPLFVHGKACGHIVQHDSCRCDAIESQSYQHIWVVMYSFLPLLLFTPVPESDCPRPLDLVFFRSSL